MPVTEAPENLELTANRSATYPMLVLDKITQDYPAPDKGTTRIVEDVSLAFDGPGINMLLGPSGCGKSTILRMMGGVRPIGLTCPTSGGVFIDGQPCTDQHDDAVMVFQSYSNRPDLSIYDNVAFPFELKLWKSKVPKAEVKARVEAMLAAVGLSDKANLRPSQLSGGQNQRVALARALVLRPRILLMDEPFGALDAQTREDMQRLLVELHHEQPCLTVFVTHDVTEAITLGDRVIILSTRPATVADDFLIEQPHPRTAWLHTAQAASLEKRVLDKLHEAGGKGQVRVSV
jgi:ABC-type nitrate/sulfonate/bicarbonate transport system ATPase subunit